MHDHRILVAGPYIGELGHEVGEWLPHVYGKFISGKFNEVHVFTRASCMGLYSAFATKVFGFDFSFNKHTDSHWMIKPHGPEVAAADELIRQVESHAQNLRCQGYHVECEMLNVSRRTELFSDKAFIRLTAPTYLCNKWVDWLPEGKKVLLAYRAYHRGARKNTPLNQLQETARDLKNRGYIPIVIGLTDTNYAAPDVDCINLVNTTTLADVLALYQISNLVIGCSTGTMHMAAFCGLPFIVWGGGWNQVRERYEVSWNPFKTWLHYISVQWEVRTSAILKGVTIAESAGIFK